MRRFGLVLAMAGPVAGCAGRVVAPEAPGDVGGNGSGSDWTSPTLGTMKWIPAGTFTMGSPAGEAGRQDDETQHQVTLTKGFLLMEAEVTQAQWQAVMGSNPSATEYKGVSLVGATLPVQNVSWEDIQTCIQKVSARDGVTYRLPTEAEWEYAARAGTARVYTGTSEAGSVCQYGNVADMTVKGKWSGWTTFGCTDGYAGLAPVKSFRANAWGLYDMTGNVWEWVQDGYGTYPGNTSDYVGDSSVSSRMFRGGSWGDSPSFARVAYRYRVSPGERYLILGFRLARSQ